MMHPADLRNGNHLPSVGRFRIAWQQLATQGAPLRDDPGLRCETPTRGRKGV